MKYMGSKGRIAKHILPIILKDRKPDQCYVEPFVGGANMIDKVDGRRIGNDVNPFLIALLKAMQQGWKPPYLRREEVAKIKENMYTESMKLVGWAGFCCCYSGVFFGGYAGLTKTKTGKDRDYIKEAIKNYNAQAEKIKNVDFKNVAYSDLEIPNSSIIYCDPPYKNTSGYKVKFDHDAFWQWARDKVDEGHKVYVSEYNAPSDFICIWSKELSSSLSANGKSGGNKIATEKLFVHQSTIDLW